MILRSPRRARLLAVAGALALTGAACGGDDDDAADTTVEVAETTGATTATTEAAPTTAAGSVVEDTTAPDTATDGTATDDTGGEPVDADRDDYVDVLRGELGDDGEAATCVAESFVDVIGADRLAEEGITPEAFADIQSFEEITETLDESAQSDLQTALEGCSGIRDLFAEQAGASAEEVACFKENVSDEQVAQLIVVQFFGQAPSPELQAAAEAVQACSQGS